jgi:hypothetical protein
MSISTVPAADPYHLIGMKDTAIYEVVEGPPLRRVLNTTQFVSRVQEKAS